MRKSFPRSAPKMEPRLVSSVCLTQVQTQEEQSRQTLTCSLGPRRRQCRRCRHHGDRHGDGAASVFQGVAGCAVTATVTTSAPRSMLCKETYSTDLMNLPGSRSHGFQYICWSETVPRPHPARIPAGCDRQVCGDLLSPHDDSPAQAPAAGPPSPLQTRGLPHSWCVCQVLSDGGALASRDAGKRPTSPRSLPQRTPRAGFYWERGHSCRDASPER